MKALLLALGALIFMREPYLAHACVTDLLETNRLTAMAAEVRGKLDNITNIVENPEFHVTKNGYQGLKSQLEELVRPYFEQMSPQTRRFFFEKYVARSGNPRLTSDHVDFEPEKGKWAAGEILDKLARALALSTKSDGEAFVDTLASLLEKESEVRFSIRAEIAGNYKRQAAALRADLPSLEKLVSNRVNERASVEVFSRLLRMPLADRDAIVRKIETKLNIKLLENMERDSENLHYANKLVSLLMGNATLGNSGDPARARIVLETIAEHLDEMGNAIRP